MTSRCKIECIWSSSLRSRHRRARERLLHKYAKGIPVLTRDRQSGQPVELDHGGRGSQRDRRRQEGSERCQAATQRPKTGFRRPASRAVASRAVGQRQPAPTGSSRVATSSEATLIAPLRAGRGRARLPLHGDGHLAARRWRCHIMRTSWVVPAPGKAAPPANAPGAAGHDSDDKSRPPHGSDPGLHTQTSSLSLLLRPPPTPGRRCGVDRKSTREFNPPHGATNEPGSSAVSAYPPHGATDEPASRCDSIGESCATADAAPSSGSAYPPHGATDETAR